MTSKVPVSVSGLPTVVSVVAGLIHSCALTADGAVYCWGGNDFGELGDGTLLERDTPIAVTLPRVTRIAAGEVHTCALTAGGTVMCWGDNSYGEVGNGAADGGSQTVPTPVAVVGLP